MPHRFPTQAVRPEDLPGVDAQRFIRYLPSGWEVQVAGLTVAGVGGIERGQRRAKYHPMAYLNEDAVSWLLGRPRADLMITHQGPAAVQGESHGSVTLQLLLDNVPPALWFHGHSTPHFDLADAGPGGVCTVVPLGDVAFPKKGPNKHEPGPNGWALVQSDEDGLEVVRGTPAFLREYRRHRWVLSRDGRLICPDLAPVAARHGWL
jgi:hypothetical protein